MIDYATILGMNPYALPRADKTQLLIETLCELTQHHYYHCLEYKKILDARQILLNSITRYEDIPFLPVRLFKEYSLKSIEEHEIVKTMTSSGTTNQQVSRIYLDKDTAALQTKALAKIVGSFIGSARLPMIIIDSPDVIKNRAMFSARGAGILGFSIFGRDKVYALDENMELDIEGLRKFIEKHRGEKIFLFGFTFMIWQHFCEKLKTLDVKLDLSDGILIHGGGWKKLADSAVTSSEFKKTLYDLCGITRVFDYYGMVEQTGTIYVECECGHLHASAFSDIIIRRHTDFSIAGIGERGIIQTLSILPRSYPGHSLLTEDEGMLLGEDDCPCGRHGKYFAVLGRLKNAEIRGCSDTYATRFE